jgi:hypothetical protein
MNRDELKKEEAKWLKRAEWLEKMLENLRTSSSMSSWVPWF